eukprot:TRINITY_DN3303_c0_g1_i1.p1 TRINITY_DN3303_c0_g1~~TRINITY_DN3303_c0_g1_i1.p1  ORF type:complete len:275 (-),score=88.64 TRINITY_DN3303_c0_g1_i1:161-985(-)
MNDCSLSPFLNELCNELKRRERILAPQLIRVQDHISNNNRFILFKWLMEVIQLFPSYSQATTHICLAITDRYLSIRPVSASTLQLLGVACILITAKLEEEAVPEVNQLNELTEFTYTNEQILQMEMNVLNALGWSLATATPFHFLGHFASSALSSDSDLLPYARIKYSMYSERAREIIKQLLEKSLLDLGFLQYYPSLVAAACVMAARRMTPVTELWPQHLEQLTGYPQEEAFFVSSLLLEMSLEEEEDDDEAGIPEECGNATHNGAQKLLQRI